MFHKAFDLFEVIYVQGDGCRSIFILLLMYTQFSQNHLLSMLSFLSIIYLKLHITHLSVFIHAHIYCKWKVPFLHEKLPFEVLVSVVQETPKL